MILINGMQAGSIPVSDRGLLYGDGVFRTMLMRRGQPLWWDAHYVKLNADCAALKIVCPSEAALWQELRLVGVSEPDCVVKIIITRGQGARGYMVDSAVQPTRVISTSALPRHPESHQQAGVKVRLCELRLSSQPLLAGIKHLNRLENVMARMEWDDTNIAEGMLLDESGYVISGTMSNLILVKDGGLITPDLRLCGVAGVARQRIMAWAAEKKISVSVQSVSLPLLIDADEAMLSNSVIGIWQITEFQGKSWSMGNMTPRIRHALYD